MPWKIIEVSEREKKKKKRPKMKLHMVLPHLKPCISDWELNSAKTQIET